MGTVQKEGKLYRLGLIRSQKNRITIHKMKYFTLQLLEGHQGIIM